MRISEGIEPGAVAVRPEWTTFSETVDGLIERLVESGRLARSVAEQAASRIYEREAIASTAMVDIGVSIPHARIDGVRGIIAAIAVSPEAVYYVADGAPIGIVVLVLSSPSLTGEHLNFLSSVSMLLQSEQTRLALRRATGTADVWRLIAENESLRD